MQREVKKRLKLNLKMGSAHAEETKSDKVVKKEEARTMEKKLKITAS